MSSMIHRIGLSTFLLSSLFAGFTLASEKPQPTLAGADCERLMTSHIDKQANPAAARFAAACRGQRVQPLLFETPAGGADSAAKSQVSSPLLGGSDLNLISDDETALVPAVTQGGSMVWGNGDDIVVVYNDSLGFPDSFSGMSVSTDAGANFTRLDPDPFGSVFTADMGSPAVAYDDSTSSWYAVVLTSDCGAQGIGVMTATDPETPGNWIAASPACVHSGTADDRPILWVDNNSSSAYYGRVYVAFNDFAAGVDGDLKIAYLDAGTWTEVTVDTDFVRNVHLIGSPGPDGSVHLFGMDEGGGAGAARANITYRSTDGGVSWSEVLATTNIIAAGVGLCAASDYFYMIPPVWRHMGWGQGAVSAGPTDAAADNILHYVWTGQGGQGDLADIYYMRSTDNGATWSGPEALNTDQQARNGPMQWLPSISVTSQGYVLASWLDRRNTTDGLNYEVYGRLSLDDGVTFQPEERISDVLIPQPSQVDNEIPACFAGDSNFHGVISNDSLVTWTDGRNALVLPGGSPDPISQMDVYFSRIPLCPEIDVTPEVLPNGVLTTPYSETLSASGGTGPYTFALSGDLPDGLGLATDVISGTPLVAGIFPFSILATDSLGCEGSQSFHVIVEPTGCSALILTPAGLPDGDQGVPYTETTVETFDGTAPYSFSVTAGNFPVGMDIDPATGLISGTPQESGAYSVNITVTDALECTGTITYGFTINCPTISLLPHEQLPDAFAGEPYVATITANGGTAPYTFKMEGGTIHNGIFFGEGGSIFGMPESGGTKQPKIRGTDVNGCQSGQIQFRMDSVNCFPGTLLCDNMSDPAINFAATDLCGGGAEWYGDNACPSSNDTGHTPSAHARWGTYLNCLDYGTEPTQDSLTSFEIDSSVCTSGEVILDFNYLLSFDGNFDTERARVEVVADGGAVQVVADNGGTAGPTCSGQANAGLGNLKSWSGWQHLQLTLPAASTFQIAFVGETDDGSIEVADTDGFEGFLVDDVHVKCKCPDDIEVTPTLLEPAHVGVPYEVTFVATGGREPYDYGSFPGIGLPPGMVLDSETGVMSDNPDPLITKVPGIHEFVLVITDANYCEIRVVMSLIVGPAGCAEITLDPVELPDWEEGTFYSEVLTPTGTTGPDPIFTLTAGALPTGLSLSPSFGVISGTPDTPGIYQFTVTVIDELTFCSGSQEYTIVINPVGCPLIEVFPEVLANAPAGEPYEQTFSATGGVASYLWFLSAGDLPEGLTLDETAGVVSGTPSGNTIFNFAITAQDQNGCFGTRAYGLEIIDYPPRVVGVHSVSDTGDGQLSSEITHSSITQIYVTLNEIVQDPPGDTDPDDVTNPANYLLAHAGADGIRDTSSCLTGVDGLDVAISVDGVTWDEPNLTARIHVNGGERLLYGAYRLLVCGSTSLKDVIDQPLDGNGDLVGGDDFVLDFGIDVDNVLLNPNFDDDLTGWSASSPTETTYALNDAGKAPTSGSVSVATLATQATVSQCVDVTDDQGYLFAASGWIESELASDPGLSAEVHFFSGAGCTGSMLSTESLAGPSGDSDDGLIFADDFECGDVSVWEGGAPCTAGPEWLPMSSWMTTPAGALSAEIRLVIDPGPSADFTTYIDDVLFFHMLFGNGFESGDTSAWD